ncbi:hypothetical protein PHMEG_00018530 [Phytophthora megakarya]|uniref:Chromo domain-containing protein n=1 Tax=Phytophthora megakarya TaxID=4795 RepID=A0A225VVE9_9STRA|nr:hypothetical protein PHMEG_00018530 [Phytophthora megakarya]
MDVHPSYLKFYMDYSLQVTAEIRDPIAAQGLILAVQELKEARRNKEKETTNWKGLKPIDNSWEPAAQFSKDIPVLLKPLAMTSNDRQFEEFITRRKNPKLSQKKATTKHKRPCVKMTDK